MPQTEEDQISRRNVEARAALVLANLPYPPLPVLASRGENAEESVASSHDIMLSAIAAHLLDTKISTRAIELLHDRKCAILDNLRLDLRNEWSQTGSRQALERCYGIIAASFRSYLALYPGSPDLRILPLDSVIRGEIQHQQGLQHLRNGTTPNDRFEPAANPEHSYANLIQAYVFKICGEDEEYILPNIHDDPPLKSPTSSTSIHFNIQ